MSSVHELSVIGFIKFTTMRNIIKISSRHNVVLEWKWREDLLCRAKPLGQASGLEVTVQDLGRLVPLSSKHAMCLTWKRHNKDVLGSSDLNLFSYFP